MMDIQQAARRNLSPKCSLTHYKEATLCPTSHIYHSQYSQHPRLASPLFHQQSFGAYNLYHTPASGLPNPNNMSLDLLPGSGRSAEENVLNSLTYNDYTELDYDQGDAFEYNADVPFDNVFTAMRQRPNDEYSFTTLEPRMVLRQHELNVQTNLDFQSNTDSHSRFINMHNDCDYKSYSAEDASSLEASSAYQEVCPWPESPSYSETTLSSSLCKQVSEDEEVMDKPYARLIYEALMQAPGHRMMLRDIYEWFLQNTTKPRESGSNGWQNSIRHNLSMNQAFENDKSAISGSRGHSRKANSVWILTDDAVRNGVQSTTRYRKPGPVRKGATSRVHAAQRQRSGARGGQAASRSVARSRKQGELTRFADTCSSTNDVPSMHQGIIDLEDYVADQSPKYEYRPATPADDCAFQPLYTLPSMPNAFDHEQYSKSEQINFVEHDTQFNQYFFEQCSSPEFGRISKIEAE